MMSSWLNLLCEILRFWSIEIIENGNKNILSTHFNLKFSLLQLPNFKKNI